MKHLPCKSFTAQQTRALRSMTAQRHYQTVERGTIINPGLASPEHFQGPSGLLSSHSLSHHVPPQLVCVCALSHLFCFYFSHKMQALSLDRTKPGIYKPPQTGFKKPFTVISGEVYFSIVTAFSVQSPLSFLVSWPDSSVLAQQNCWEASCYWQASAFSLTAAGTIAQTLDVTHPASVGNLVLTGDFQSPDWQWLPPATGLWDITHNELRICWAWSIGFHVDYNLSRDFTQSSSWERGRKKTCKIFALN